MILLLFSNLRVCMNDMWIAVILLVRDWGLILYRLLCDLRFILNLFRVVIDIRILRDYRVSHRLLLYRDGLLLLRIWDIVKLLLFRFIWTDAVLLYDDRGYV